MKRKLKGETEEKLRKMMKKYELKERSKGDERNNEGKTVNRKRKGN